MRRILILIVANFLLEIVFLRFVWTSSRPTSGQWALTYFGHCDDGPALVHGKAVSEATPPIDIDRDGLVGLAPGQSLALPLTGDVAYNVRQPTQGFAPYVVLLSDVNGPPPFGADRATARCAIGSLVPTVVEKGPEWAPWQSDAPWRADADRLQSLAHACSSGDLRVWRDKGEVMVVLGNCRWSQTVGPNRTPAMGVIAGPVSARIERVGGWAKERRLNPAGLVITLILGALHAMILAGAMRGRSPIVLLAIVAYSSIVARVGIFSLGLVLLPALLIWIALAAGGVLMLTWRLLQPIATTRARRIAIFAAHALFVLSLGAAGFAIPGFARAAIGGPAVIDAPRVGPTRCLVAGYSTAAGIDIVPRGADAFSILDARCSMYAHSFARHAFPGHIFEEVHEYLLSPRHADLAPIGTVLFWGGDNDDIFWPMLARHHVASALILSAYVIETILRSLDSGSLLHPSSVEVRGALDRAAERSAALADEQATVIQSTVTAVRANGHRFIFAHDFFAYDMDRGRSSARQSLLERRRRAVLAADGEFVDLLEGVAGQVGVAWFDDFIHPSAWGHEKLADQLCRAVSTGRKSPR